MVHGTPYWDGELADPVKVHWKGQWLSSGTGTAENGGRQSDGRYFPLLISADNQHWELCGGLLEPLPNPELKHHWAPELRVVQSPETGGECLQMVFSAGATIDQMYTYVAHSTEDRPVFRSAKAICHGIDGHIFGDGARRYLYRCTKRTDGERGTAIMGNEITPEHDLIGAQVPILQAVGPEYMTPFGYVAEGMFVVKKFGKYWMFISRGYYEWQYDTVVMEADHPLGPFTILDPERGSFHLRSADPVRRPGHVSLYSEGQRDTLMYHAYYMGRKVRQAFEMPLYWGPDGPSLQPLR